MSSDSNPWKMSEDASVSDPHDAQFNLEEDLEALLDDDLKQDEHDVVLDETVAPVAAAGGHPTTAPAAAQATAAGSTDNIPRNVRRRLFESEASDFASSPGGIPTMDICKPVEPAGLAGTGWWSNTLWLAFLHLRSARPSTSSELITEDPFCGSYGIGFGMKVAPVCILVYCPLFLIII
jgi:hypothetical protein